MPVYRERKRGHGALGDQGLHIVREAGRRAEELERERRRAMVEEASVRPAPGTSDLLGRPLRAVTVGALGKDGKVKAVDAHDLTAMLPVHLVGHPLKLYGRKG